MLWELRTAMQKLRITPGFGTGRQRMVLERNTTQTFTGVRVHVSTGYNRVEEGERRDAPRMM
jgi:hypothetical protein